MLNIYIVILYKLQETNNKSGKKIFLKKYKIYVQCKSLYFLVLNYLTLASRRYNYSFLCNLILIHPHSKRAHVN